MKITQDKQNIKLLNMSRSIPVFVFCYSPYCSICKGIHPDWHNLTLKYKDDPKVMIAEVDCNSHENVCAGSYKVKGYPSFVKILKALPKKIHPQHDFDSLDSEASDLRRLKMDELCERFPSDEQKYPALVVSKKENRVDTCAFIDEVVKEDQTLIPLVFGKDKQKEDSFDVFVSRNDFVHMNKDFTVSNIRDFMKEYRTPNFGLVKWSEVLQRNRTIVIILVSNQDQVSRFNDVANKNSGDFYWNSITVDKYNELSGRGFSKDDAPAAIVSHKNKKKFCVYKKVDPRSIKDKLSEEWCESGEVVNKKMSSIFHDIILFPGLSRRLRMLMVGGSAVLIFGLLVGAFCCTSSPTPKFE